MLAVTGEHPVRTANGEWEAVGDLTTEDDLVSANGATLDIISLTVRRAPEGEAFSTYNISVFGSRTYYVQSVGSTELDREVGVWVHNANNNNEGCVGIDPVTITLERLPGMPAREFARKGEALRELGEQGLLRRAANPVARDRSITDSFRRDAIERIWAQYGNRNREFANRLIERVTRKMSPDHVWELQLAGPDTASNLRWLDRFTNAHIGIQQIRPQIRNLPVGTPIRINIKY